MVKFSHSLCSTDLRLFGKESCGRYFKATSNLVFLPVRETSWGERDCSCPVCTNLGLALLFLRVAPYNHLLPRDRRLLARLRAGQSGDGNHVMHQHLPDTASKYFGTALNKLKRVKSRDQPGRWSYSSRYSVVPIRCIFRPFPLILLSLPVLSVETFKVSLNGALRNLI